MGRFALLVGCCYPENEDGGQLQGCYNDVHRMEKLLISKFDFDPYNVQVLTDKPGSRPRPTGYVIKDKLWKMIERAKPGDVVLFYFSGHGTYDQFPDEFRYCKRHEGIVPCDENPIFSADFLEMESAMPKGSDLVLIADSCFSGGLIGPAVEQVGPGFSPDICHVPRSHNLGPGRKSKMMPMASIMRHLLQSNPLNHHHRSDTRTIMRSNFRNNASIIYREPRHQPCSVPANRAILISGCQSDETASDDSGNRRRPYGLFTDALCSTLWKLSGPIDNYSLVEEIRKKIKGKGQHPCLYCSDVRADAPFLRQRF